MAHRQAYTLVEILVATTLSLVILTAVMQVFATVSHTVSDARAVTEIQGQLRLAANRLAADLTPGNLTAVTASGQTTAAAPPPMPYPPSGPNGYFEYIEGPIGPVIDPETVFIDSANGNAPDTTVGDVDDVLMFTVTNSTTPFIGRWGQRDANGVIQTHPITSNSAEIIWFVRGHTLHRRVLLIMPGFETNPYYAVDVASGNTASQLGTGSSASWYTNGFFNHTDISVRLDTSPVSGVGLCVTANSLNDLSKRENRFAHGLGLPVQPPSPLTADPTKTTPPQGTDFPFDARRWGPLGMPTIRECSANGTTSVAPWIPGNMVPGSPSSPATVDLWTNPFPWTDTRGNALADAATGDMLNLLGSRVGEDVILDNCIGFDVKAWDPGAPLVSTPAGLTLAPGDRVPNGQGGFSDTYLNALTQSLTGAVYQRVGYGAFVDLNYMCRLGPESNSLHNTKVLCDTWRPQYVNYMNTGSYTGEPMPLFFDAGDDRSGLRGTPPNLSPIRAAVYDTGSNYYESATYTDSSGNTWNVNTGDYIPDPAATPPNSKPKRLFKDGVNGVDDNGDGFVDDIGEPFNGELQAPPPYTQPLQAIQIKIRVLEPDSKQIREVTVVQKFY